MSEAQSNEAVFQNVLLYWSQDDVPESVLDVRGVWEDVCPDWNIELFTRDRAIRFLIREYGTAIADLFKSCAIPAMQSDFFRVFWALRVGGVYCDLTYQPKAPLCFFDVTSDLTVVRWYHGRIVNGLFYGTPKSIALKAIAHEVTANVSLQKGDNIWLLTGPGPWIGVLKQASEHQFSVVEYSEVFKNHFAFSKYKGSTRGTDSHWSEIQKTGLIFQ